jgi:hypothetical protein
MRKVGPRCVIGLQLHVILRQTKVMDDMQSQEFLGMADMG